jgi:hypothetical protein
MSNLLHHEMLRQFAAELSHSARNLVTLASLMQVARHLGTPELVEAHWVSVQDSARRRYDVLRQWEILGIVPASLKIWEHSPRRAALVQAAERWARLPSQAAGPDHEEAVRSLRRAALSV